MEEFNINQWIDDIVNCKTCNDLKNLGIKYGFKIIGISEITVDLCPDNDILPSQIEKIPLPIPVSF